MKGVGFSLLSRSSRHFSRFDTSALSCRRILYVCRGECTPAWRAPD